MHVMIATLMSVLCVSGVVLCKLNELSSAEQVISAACRDSHTHVCLHLAALDQLADCLAAQVVFLLFFVVVVVVVVAQQLFSSCPLMSAIEV